MGTLDTSEKEEDMDRSEVTRNARGCIEPHWSPGAMADWRAEVDFNAIYETGGELEYLLERAQQAVAEGRPFKGKPLNQRARDAQRDFDPDLSETCTHARTRRNICSQIILSTRGCTPCCGVDRR